MKNIANNFGRPYLLNFSDEPNIIADVMENRLGMRYTTHMINCNHHREGFNAVYKSTVNIDFLILQPRISKLWRTRVGGKK